MVFTPSSPRVRMIPTLFALTSSILFHGIAISADEWPAEPKTVKGEDLTERFQGVWALPSGIESRNALRSGDLAGAKGALRRLAAEDSRTSDVDSNECLLLIELMESRTGKDRREEARSLLKSAVRDQASSKEEALFLRAKIMGDYLGDGLAAERLYKRIVASFARGAEFETADDLRTAYERASKGKPELTGYQKRAYRKLIKALESRESSSAEAIAKTEDTKIVHSSVVAEGGGEIAAEDLERTLLD